MNGRGNAANGKGAQNAAQNAAQNDAQNDTMAMREAVAAAREDFKAAVEEFTAVAETDPGEAAMAAALEALSGARGDFKDARGDALEEFLMVVKGGGDAAASAGKMNSPVHGGGNEHLPDLQMHDLPGQALDGMSHGPDFLIG